jgi:hypothetical protein
MLSTNEGGDVELDYTFVNNSNVGVCLASIEITPLDEEGRAIGAPRTISAFSFLQLLKQ